ncbi:hypothetical protein PsorP6_004147 [Peronosclerospora sorghi]|uniref:Uncharacterized protein n=1 Tax=Peronosclerospora sorghi TaxID=230839 RepID=A0ACC0VND6_9STRA|nr:hypothetical protein PsorP6_004147 [Peronosclerospora sorghi]
MTLASSLVRLAFLEDVERQSRCARKTRRAKLALAFLQLERPRSTIRERSFLAASCLKLPFQSPWYHFYATADDSSFLSATTVTRGVFNYVLGYFQDDFVVRSGPGKVGRPARVPHKHTVLAIVLMYYAVTMELKVLQKLFGVPPATLSRTFTETDKALANFDDLHLKPSPSGDAWSRRKRSFWKTVLVTETFAFGVDATVIWGKHYCTVSWNDSETSRGFQAKLLHERFTLPEMGAIADSAFPVSNEMFKKIITPLKQGDIDTIPREFQATSLAISNSITAVRQAAEWGMGATLKCFRRLLQPLPYDSEVRDGR